MESKRGVGPKDRDSVGRPHHGSERCREGMNFGRRAQRTLDSGPFPSAIFACAQPPRQPCALGSEFELCTELSASHDFALPHVKSCRRFSARHMTR